MTRQDHEYYLRREQQERLSAERCDDHSARLAHLELANRYAEILGKLPSAQQQLPSARQQIPA